MTSDELDSLSTMGTATEGEGAPVVVINTSPSSYYATAMIRQPTPVEMVSLTPNRLRPSLALMNGRDSSQPPLFVSHAATDRSCCNMFNAIMSPFSCTCLPIVSRSLERSTYVAVFDNRIEWNEPRNDCSHYTDPGCCNCFNFSCDQTDNVYVAHYDRAIIANVAVAQCCFRPCCTHCHPCPTYCGLAGESIVIWSNRRSCWDWCRCSPCCHCCQIKTLDQFANVGAFTRCLGQWRRITGIQNAAALAQAINQARHRTGLPTVVIGLAPTHQSMN